VACSVRGTQAPTCLIAIGRDPGREQASAHSFVRYFEKCVLLSHKGQLANSLSHHFHCFHKLWWCPAVARLHCTLASLALANVLAENFPAA
jgi:hypothetical protein